MPKNKEKQEKEEVACVKIFLPFYTKKEVNYIKPHRIQNHAVDIVVHFKDGTSQKIQHTMGDQHHGKIYEKNITDRAKGKTQNISFIIRNPHDQKNIQYFISSIRAKVEKYNKKKEDIGDIILILEDIGAFYKNDFDIYFAENGDSGLADSFKEVWYVGRFKNRVYKIL